MKKKNKSNEPDSESQDTTNHDPSCTVVEKSLQTYSEKIDKHDKIRNYRVTGLRTTDRPTPV